MLRFLDRQSFPVDDRVRNLPPSLLQQPLNRSTRDIHGFGRLFLMQPFEVAERDRLEFIEPDLDDLRLRERNPGRLEEIEPAKAAAVSWLLRTRHLFSIDGNRQRDKKPPLLIYCAYAYNMRTASCRLAGLLGKRKHEGCSRKGECPCHATTEPGLEEWAR